MSKNDIALGCAVMVAVVLNVFLAALPFMFAGLVLYVVLKAAL